MLILGIDTATSAIAVGLSDGERTASDHHLDPRGHTEHLAPLVRDLLAREGTSPRALTAIAVGTGPGPFTGLRVGMVTALTMGHALGIPVHGICSLDVLAHQALCHSCGGGPAGHQLRSGDEVLVASDARRKEVYWARYAVELDRDGVPVSSRVSGPAVERPAHLPEELRRMPTAGRGPLLFPDLFDHPVGPLDVDAGVLARLATDGVRSGAAMPVEPLYLRRPDALTTAERGGAR